MKKFWIFLFLPLLIFGAPKKKSTYHLNDTKIINPTIVIDAGHGGKDHGACVKSPWCREKRLALETALLVEKHLKQLGYKVIMTRRNDRFVSLEKRVELANKMSSDLFVSIHYNSCPSPQPHGIEIHYTEDKKNKKRTKASEKLAQTVLDKLATRTKARNRGLKKGKLYVTRNAQMPAILVEGGFVTNQTECKKIVQNAYKDTIAKSIAEGIDKFLKQ